MRFKLTRIQYLKNGTTDPESPYARAREGVTRKQQESEPEPSVTEPLLLTVATDCGDESRGVRVDCAAHAVAKDSRSRALISSNLGRPRRRCATSPGADSRSLPRARVVAVHIAVGLRGLSRSALASAKKAGA